jgi:hypothetical protein|tara:strand:- start:259 stop:453 length:195 start_codon:yes stop_codon:yes gene_type:complete
MPVKKKPAVKKQFSTLKKRLLGMHPSDMRDSELNRLSKYIREDQTFSKAWRAATPKPATKKKVR